MKTQWHKSTCPYCGVGCGLQVGVKGGNIVGIRGMHDHPVNAGDICTIAANLAFVFSAEGRLTQPMIRYHGELTQVSWDIAVHHISTKLKRIIEEYGPDAIAFYGGAANLTEEYYLMNKLMKAAIGTNNVECSTRMCMASSAAGFSSTLGADAPPTCYEDIEEADLFFIAGNNMAVSLPVLFRRVKKAREKNKAKVIVVDPRRTETADIADIHLQLRPGTDVALNNGLAHILLQEGYVNEKEIEPFVSGLADLKEKLKEYPPALVEKITGCSEEQLFATAHTIGQAKAMLTFWFQGYNHSTQAVFKNNSLHNLSLLTGNFCRPGAGPLSITGEANALGNRWTGTLSHLLPGMRQVVNSQHRQELADFWNIPVDNIQMAPGRSILEIIHGLHAGDIKALWVCTTNPAASIPDTSWVEEGLGKTDLLIVQDIFHPTETTMLADVVLPGAQWSEKTGTFINSERRIELVEKLIEPPGEAKPDAEIICMIARAMGYDQQFNYQDAEEIFEEWKEVTSGRICDMTGISYERLRNSVGVQLPCPDRDHPGTPRLFLDHRFPRTDGRAALLARDYCEPAEKTDEKYPLILITGRLKFHFNTRTRTGRVPVLNQHAPENTVHLNQSDADHKNIVEGEEITICSRRGRVKGIVHISGRIQQGTIYMNAHYGKALLNDGDKLANLVTNKAYDIHSKQPELKFCAVRVE